MIDAMTILVVGGAVMVPTLLEVPTPTVPTETGLVPGGSQTVLTNHGNAAAFYRTTSILGITTTASSKAGVFIGTRNAEVMRALIPTHGSRTLSPGFPKLSASEVFELIRVVLEALKMGLSTDSGDPNGYVLSKEVSVLGGVGFVDQGDAFTELLTLPQGGVPTDFDEPSGLAVAVGEMLKQRFLASTVGVTQGESYNSTDAVRSVSAVCGAMDQQGVNFDITDLGDLGDSIVDSAKSLPGRIGNVVGNVLGDAIGGIVTSTPFLLALAGFVVYQAVKRT